MAQARLVLRVNANVRVAGVVESRSGASYNRCALRWTAPTAIAASFGAARNGVGQAESGNDTEPQVVLIAELVLLKTKCRADQKQKGGRPTHLERRTARGVFRQSARPQWEIGASTDGAAAFARAESASNHSARSESA